MWIESYSFGSLVIGGKKYDSDLLVCGEALMANWWRREGHGLCLDDLTWVLQRSPRVLVIGNGYFGRLQVPKPLVQELSRRGIRIVTAKSPEAVTTFNELSAGSEVVAGAFHLTC